MGAGASSPSAFFAFKVVQQEYDLLISREELPKMNLQLHLEALYATAMKEYHLASPLECTEPSCILVKMKSFDPPDDAKKHCKEAIAEALRAREKSKPKIVESDYSKGFSGSAADTKAEKDFEKMMRDDVEPEDDDFPILRPPRIMFPEHKKALEQAGLWCRELTANGCFMYCHSLTRNIVSLRPDDYEDEIEEQSSDGKNAKNDVDPANGLKSCEISDLPSVLEELVNNGEKKTPLILDGTDGTQCLTFFSMKSMLEDVSTLVVPYSVSGIKRGDIMERCRSRLVGAIKSGSTFVLYLGGVTIEHADFKKKLCKKDAFPAETFQQRGEKLLGPKTKPRYKMIVREADTEDGTGDVFARDGFQVLVVSTLTPFEYEAKLQDCIPLGYMIPIYVYN